MPYLYGDDINKLQGRAIVGLSHAAGYACGYHLVKYFLQKQTYLLKLPQHFQHKNNK